MRVLITVALLLSIVPQYPSEQTLLEEKCDQKITFDLKSNIIGIALERQNPINDNITQSSNPAGTRRQLSEWYMLRNIRANCHQDFTFLRSDSSYAANVQMFRDLGNANACRKELEVFSLFHIKESVNKFQVRSCLALENDPNTILVAEWILQPALPYGKDNVDGYLEEFLVAPDKVDAVHAVGDLQGPDQWMAYEEHADFYAYVLTGTVFAVTVLFWLFLVLRWLCEKLFGKRIYSTPVLIQHLLIRRNVNPTIPN